MVPPSFRAGQTDFIQVQSFEHNRFLEQNQVDSKREKSFLDRIFRFKKF